jgi:hypothetical protein
MGGVGIVSTGEEVVLRIEFDSDLFAWQAERIKEMRIMR